MCGFAGFLGSSAVKNDAARVLANMADTIISRGPDDCGLWSDPSGIGLAHRRLSIVDLSSAGHQPMVSCCGRYVIAFNGEVYNHQVLRAELSNGFKGGGVR